MHAIILGTFDVQKALIVNDSLIIEFIHGSTSKGVFIVIIDDSSYKLAYFTIEKPLLSNIVNWTLPYYTKPDSSTGSESSSMTQRLLIYETESNGLLKDSESLMPVKSLKLPGKANLQLLTDIQFNGDDSELTNQ